MPSSLCMVRRWQPWIKSQDPAFTLRRNGFPHSGDCMITRGPSRPSRAVQPGSHPEATTAMRSASQGALGIVQQSDLSQILAVQGTEAWTVIPHRSLTRLTSVPPPRRKNLEAVTLSQQLHS
eukprot:5032050-Amphidinium_carterae.5